MRRHHLVSHSEQGPVRVHVYNIHAQLHAGHVLHGAPVHRNEGGAGIAGHGDGEGGGPAVAGEAPSKTTLDGVDSESSHEPSDT